MDYRGQDLDLRTARWSAASTEPSGWREAAPASPHPAQPTPRTRRAPIGQRTAVPIWVDDTLLACANQAFDVALAYRSAEVRLEHLAAGHDARRGGRVRARSARRARRLAAP